MLLQTDSASSTANGKKCLYWRNPLNILALPNRINKTPTIIRAVERSKKNWFIPKNKTNEPRAIADFPESQPFSIGRFVRKYFVL